MAFNMNPASTQVKYPFNGHLNPNEVFGSIFNMILYQEVHYPELAGDFNFVQKFKQEGYHFGDTAFFYDQDILESRKWLGDAEAADLLSTKRPDDPKCQAVVLDQFRIVKTTLDNYLTKRAWSTENAFTTFNSIVRSMVAETKRAYEIQMMNCFVGSMKGNAKKSTVEVPLSDITATGEEKNKLVAQVIAETLANTIIDMRDYSRDYNDYEFYKSYTADQLMVIWNSAYINKIRKMSLPVIYNNAGLIDKFDENVLPAKFFTEKVTAENAAVSGLSVVGDEVVISGTYSGPNIISYEEGHFVDSTKGNAMVHIMPGDVLPKGATFKVGEAGFVDEDQICKIITKDTIKYLASFETATEFWNPQALLTNQMLIWGFSKPERLLGQPCVTLHAD